MTGAIIPSTALHAAAACLHIIALMVAIGVGVGLERSRTERPEWDDGDRESLTMIIALAAMLTVGGIALQVIA